jgi:hypothetical protein
MITGTMSGMDMIPLAIDEPLPRHRAKPRAAAVPSITDRTVTITATWMLRSKAEVQLVPLKKLSYHFSDHPGGGNSRKGDELRDAGITIKEGRRRKTATTHVTAMALRLITAGSRDRMCAPRGRTTP